MIKLVVHFVDFYESVPKDSEIPSTPYIKKITMEGNLADVCYQLILFWPNSWKKLREERIILMSGNELTNNYMSIDLCMICVSLIGA